MTSSLEAKIIAEMADIELTTEALAGIFADMINTQLLIRDLLAILPADLLLVDEMGRVLAVTPKLLREVLHCKRDEVCGKYLSAVLLEYLQEPKQIFSLDQAVLAGVQWCGEFTLKSGEHIGARLCPLPLADGNVSALLLEPLTENIGMFWRNRLLHMADESREMIMRGKIAGGVMHDVKNMIQNVSGNVQYIQLKTSPGEAVRARLDMVNGQMSTMNQLINSFLHFGNHAELDPAESSINALMHETVQLFSAVGRINGVEIFEEPEYELPDVFMDAMRIKQVLMNCLENGIEAIAERRSRGDKFYGEITVKTYADSAAKMVCVSVEDNGIGLTPEQQTRFFEPFFTTKKDGHGIGTSFSRAIVELHGGIMAAENREDGGCKVLIKLPAAEKSDMVAEDSLDLYDELGKLDW